MRNVVLDASALLAMLNDEPGAERVAAVIERAVVSSVNFSEVVATLAEYGMEDEVIEKALVGLGLDVVAFDRDSAWTAGLLRPVTRHLGLSLGDRACLATGIRHGIPVFTTDRRWSELELGVAVELAR